MPVQKVTTLYTFDELDNKPREKARDSFRETLNEDDSWYDVIFDDAVQCGSVLGICIHTHGKRKSPKIYFRGFSSQGDGACYVGHYLPEKDASTKIRDHAPKDEVLHRIADQLTELQNRNAWCVTASTEHHGHYYHKYCMSVELSFMENDEGVEQSSDAEERLTELLRDFADWIYHQLEKEDEYRHSDENVEEIIRNNELLFHRDGSPE